MKPPKNVMCGLCGMVMKFGEWAVAEIEDGTNNPDLIKAMAYFCNIVGGGCGAILRPPCEYDLTSDDATNPNPEGMTMSSPKECPDFYCGCVEDEHEYEHAPDGIRYACSCGVSGPWCESLQAAFDAWNSLPRASNVPPHLLPPINLDTNAVSPDQPKRFPFPDMDAAMERIETLEAALRKVAGVRDEMRGELTSDAEMYKSLRFIRQRDVIDWIDALKAPCMEVEK
jgi:hypothetical protein